MDFANQFKAARRSSTPLVAVRTADPMSTMALVRKSLNGKAATIPMLCWDVMRGLQGVNRVGLEAASQVLDGGDPIEASTRPSDMLTLLGKLKQDDVIVFMINAHRFWKDDAVMQGIWNLREPFKLTGRMLIMTATMGATLPAELAEDVLVIDEPLPTPAELETILKNIAEAARVPQLSESETTAAIDAVAGLAAFPAEQALAMSRTKTGIDLDTLWEKKRQAIEQQPGMTVYRGETPEPVGLENARGFLKKILAGRKRYRAILFIDEIEKAFAGTGTDLSGVKTGMTGTWCTWTTEQEADGVLCIGVPGGGKTHLAKWAGSVANIPTILFDFAGMQSGIIGSTEERLRTALKTVDAISQGSVLVIATCNAIGQMPPEILRRFNLGTFFFDLMNADERAACWKCYRAKYEIPEGNELPTDIGWTGSEIRECCKLAYQLMVPLKEAAEFIVPVARSSGERIRNLRDSAAGRYISASHPGVYQQQGEPEGEAKPVRKFRDDDVALGPLTFDKKGGRA